MTSWSQHFLRLGEGGDDRKVIGFGDRVFPVENSNVGRTIGTGRLLNSVCVQERLMRI